MAPARLADLLFAAQLLLLHFAQSLRVDLRGPAVPAGAYRQELGNVGDLQYHGDVVIGGQLTQGIFDTGSFELVVFSQSCSTCGVAPAYSEQKSSSFVQGGTSQVHAYGSGSCRATDGFDSVSVGGLASPRQAMWLATDCEMPLLNTASFNAIVGLGPPGEPEFTARETLRKLEELEGRYLSQGQDLPRKYAEMRAKAAQELESALKKDDLLESLRVNVFSVCLGEEQGSPGYLVWNDATREGAPGVHAVPVVGNITWGFSLQNLALRMPGTELPPRSLGCERGCGAIVDTGTSLFSLPTEMYDEMYRAVDEVLYRLGDDCSDLTQFPDLVMDLGGHELRFPPSSYMGHLHGNLNAEVEQFFRARDGEAHPFNCRMLIMDAGSEKKTSLGPLVILGMPFFREYYTTFDLGSGRGDRRLLISKANNNCQPGGQALSSARRQIRARGPRQVDASKVLAPRWLREPGSPRF